MRTFYAFMIGMVIGAAVAVAPRAADFADTSPYPPARAGSPAAVAAAPSMQTVSVMPEGYSPPPPWIPVS